MYVGYKNFSSKGIVAANKWAEGKGVVIDLSPDRNVLKEVKVIGAKPFIEQHADKLVLNVAESPIAQGGTAADALGRAPGVVEQGGGYQVRGKNALVTIDGKVTNLSGSDLAELLASMPSNSVEKVEVVYNPSAKYDAAGGAIINVITKKSTAFGTNGSVNAGLGTGRFARYNGGFSFNHRNEKLNLYGGYDYQHTKQYRRLTADRVLNQETRVGEDTYQVTGRNSSNARFGLDVDLTKRQSVGVLVRGLLNYRTRDAETNSLVAGLTGPPYNTGTLQTDGNTRIVNPSINLYYRVVLDSVGSELKINADYLGYNKRFGEQYTSQMVDQASGSATTDLLNNNSPAQNSVTSLTADYTHPMGKNTSLEAGFKSIRTLTDNDIQWQYFDGGWLNDARRTNHFIYREQINAAYASFNKAVKKVQLQAGLRAEHTNTRGESLTLNQVNQRDYLSLFPSLSLTYNQSEKQQWSVAYQRKIDRFQFDIVNPFITYISQYAYYQGNPAVRPSFSQNFSVSHTYDNALTTSLTYARHTDVLAEVYRRAPGSNAIISSDANLSGAVSVDANLSLTKQLLANKLTTATTLGMMYVRYRGATDSLLNQGRAGWSLTSNNTLRLAKGYKAEFFAFYRSSLTYGAYVFRPSFGGSIGLSKSILDQAGTLTLNISDPFNLQTRRYDVRSAGISASNVDKTESLFVRLNFSYKFGNKKVKASKSRRSGIEDEKYRLESN